VGAGRAKRGGLTQGEADLSAGAQGIHPGEAGLPAGAQGDSPRAKAGAILLNRGLSLPEGPDLGRRFR
jgi:hypothetical protein